MKSRWVLNLALALFLGVLLAVVHFAAKNESVPPPVPLTLIDPAQVHQVTIERPGHPVITLVRRGNRWTMTSPVNARADQFRIGKLLQLTGAPVQERFSVPPGGLARFGLAAPLLTLHFGTESIAFGDTNPVTQGRYVLYQGKVALLSSTGFTPETLRHADFFSTRLLNRGWDAKQFTFPQFRLTLHQGVWQVSPANPRLSTDVVNDFVDDWHYARALSVSESAGGPAIGTVRIEYTEAPSRQPRSATIDILEERPELVLYRPDEHLSYHFPAEMAARLLHLSPKP